MTRARVLTAALLVPVVVTVVWWGSTGLVTAFTGIVLLLALHEFFALGGRREMLGYRAWTGLCALALVFSQWAATGVGALGPDPALGPEVILVVFGFGAATIALSSRRPRAEILGALGISSAALLFVALPFSYLVRLHGAGRQGPKLLLFALVLIWVGDTLGYFVGRSVGRLPMAPQLSPKKTWEGASANLLGSLLVAAAFSRWMTGPGLLPTLLDLLLMAALGNLAGQLGDLLESGYKRSAGVKDSGALLPGHGGVLDRIDALILAAPVVWYYFHWITIRHV